MICITPDWRKCMDLNGISEVQWYHMIHLQEHGMCKPIFIIVKVPQNYYVKQSVCTIYYTMFVQKHMTPFFWNMNLPSQKRKKKKKEKSEINKIHKKMLHQQK